MPNRPATVRRRRPNRARDVFNDTHGHLAGDDLLRRVAEAIRASSRDRDRTYQDGGDEFRLLLRRAEPGDARVVVDRVASAIAAITAGEAIAVTASVGVANWPADGGSATNLVEVADQALHEVKPTQSGDRTAGNGARG